MNNRNDWEFEYTASVLAKAAEQKREYRKTRVAWWEAKQQEVMAEVRETGIEINEGVSYALQSSAVRAPQMMIRADLQTKLGDCFTKIKEHTSAVREYDGWLQVLNANSEARLKLKHGDWLFFFAEN